MQLTLRSDYALRTLIYLGTRAAPLCRIDDISRSFGIPKTHLTKVVNELARAGYIETLRGRNGGIRLAGDPATIGVGEVIRHTEETLAVMGCVSDRSFCRIDGCCVLQRALQEALRAFLRTLDGYTLADLLKPRAQLLRRLGIATTPAPAS